MKKALTILTTFQLIVSWCAAEGETVTGIDPNTGEKVEIPYSEIFRIVEVETPPKLIESKEIPLPKGLKKEVSATVVFVVSSEGIPHNIEIEKINKKKYKKLVIQAVENSKYEPAKHGEKNVPAKIRVPIKIGPNKSVVTTPGAAAPSA